MRNRPIYISLALIAGTIATGLTLRLAHLGLPFLLTKYGGSTLWALMIYWIISSLRPRWSLHQSAWASGFIAAAAEIFQLYRTPDLDAFRRTMAGALLLGRVFSTWDFIAYAFGIALGVCADRTIRQASLSR